MSFLSDSYFHLTRFITLPLSFEEQSFTLAELPNEKSAKLANIVFGTRNQGPMSLILGYLDSKSLVRLSATSRQMFDAINSTNIASNEEISSNQKKLENQIESIKKFFDEYSNMNQKGNVYDIYAQYEKIIAKEKVLKWHEQLKPNLYVTIALQQGKITYPQIKHLGGYNKITSYLQQEGQNIQKILKKNYQKSSSQNSNIRKESEIFVKRKQMRLDAFKKLASTAYNEHFRRLLQADICREKKLEGPNTLRFPSQIEKDSKALAMLRDLSKEEKEFFTEILIPRCREQKVFQRAISRLLPKSKVLLEQDPFPSNSSSVIHFPLC